MDSKSFIMRREDDDPVRKQSLKLKVANLIEMKYWNSILIWEIMNFVVEIS